MASKIYKGDVGTLFQVDAGSDVSSATLLQLRVKTPTQSVTWTAAVNGSINTQIDYTSEAGDLNESGPHSLQSYAEFGGGSTKWSGESVTFIVYELHE